MSCTTFTFGVCAPLAKWTEKQNFTAVTHLTPQSCAQATFLLFTAFCFVFLLLSIKSTSPHFLLNWHEGRALLDFVKFYLLLCQHATHDRKREAIGEVVNSIG